MTITGPDGRAGAPDQAAVDAAMLVLDRMGLTPADLLSAPAARPAAPTFAEYVPVVSALVTDGCRRAYGSYWNRVTEQWGSRGIDEPTPGEIRQLVQYVRANVVPRRNSRGGRSAAEHLIGALRCLYKHAEDNGLINPADNPARKVDKPAACPRPATRSPTSASRRSTRQQRPPGMTPTLTPCCSASTPRPPAGGAAPWPCARRTSTRNSA